MIVCVCEGVSDRSIRDLAKTGVQTLEDVKRACRAGGDCGLCRAELRRMLRKQRAPQGEER